MIHLPLLSPATLLINSTLKLIRKQKLRIIHNLYPKYSWLQEREYHRPKSVSRYFTIIIIQSLLIKTNSELRIINKSADKERILKKLIFAAIFSDQTLSFPTITEWPMSRMSLSCRPSLATGIAGQRGPQILRCYVYLSISSISCHHHRSSTL